MARLINCKSCNHEISQLAKICPSCGDQLKMTKLIKCKSCDHDISKSAKICPSCGHEATMGLVKKIILSFFTLMALLVLLGMCAVEESINDDISQQKDGTLNAIEQVDPRPNDQIKIIDIIIEAQKSAKNSANDMQRGSALNERGINICAILPQNKEIKNWVAKVLDISANSDGKGVLTIDLSNDIELGTWNNAFSDMLDNTLMNPNS